MRTFFLLLLLVFNLAFAWAQGKIELKEFKHPDCTIKEAELRGKIATCTDIDIAEQLLVKQCNLLGGQMEYTLFCKTCDNSKKMRFFPRESFPLYSGSLNSFIYKGGSKVYSLLQLKKILTDTLAIIDSLVINISGLPADDKEKAKKMYLVNKQAGKYCYPIFYRNNKLMVFKQDSTATVPLEVCFLQDSTEISLPGKFYPHYLDEKERRELVKNATQLKYCDPAIDENDLFDYLQGLVQSKYSKVDVPGLRTLLASLQL